MVVRLRQFGVALFIAGALSAPAYGSSITPVMLEAYTGTVAGTNTCGGGGSPDAISNFFSTDVGFGLGNVGGSNTGIGACGLSGGVSDMTSAAGPLSSSSSLNSAGFAGGLPSTTYTGAASATADYGTISASASGILTGPAPAAGVSESVAFGIVSDSLTVSGAGSGYIAFDYTMSGSLTLNSPYLGGGTQEVQVQVGSTSERVFYGQSSQVGTAIYAEPGTAGITGCTTTTYSFTCTNATFGTALIPITFGTATAYNFGLIVSAWPENSTMVDPDITLTGITVYDSNQQSIADFSITSGSGTTYGADGLESTPEPGTWLLAGCALVAIGVARRRLSRKILAAANLDDCEHP